MCSFSCITPISTHKDSPSPFSVPKPTENSTKVLTLKPTTPRPITRTENDPKQEQGYPSSSSFQTVKENPLPHKTAENQENVELGLTLTELDKFINSHIQTSEDPYTPSGDVIRAQTPEVDEHAAVNLKLIAESVERDMNRLVKWRGVYEKDHEEKVRREQGEDEQPQNLKEGREQTPSQKQKTPEEEEKKGSEDEVKEEDERPQQHDDGREPESLEQRRKAFEELAVKTKAEGTHYEVERIFDCGCVVPMLVPIRAMLVFPAEGLCGGDRCEGVRGDENVDVEKEEAYGRCRECSHIRCGDCRVISSPDTGSYPDHDSDIDSSSGSDLSRDPKFGKALGMTNLAGRVEMAAEVMHYLTPFLPGSRLYLDRVGRGKKPCEETVLLAKKLHRVMVENFFVELKELELEKCWESEEDMPEEGGEAVGEGMIKGGDGETKGAYDGFDAIDDEIEIIPDEMLAREEQIQEPISHIK